MTVKVGLISLGCAKNLVNSEQMLYLLREAGFDATGETDGADVVVVNTCGFIESAKTEAIETILELAAMRDEGRCGRIIVAGCLAQRYQAEIFKELPEVDGLVGTGSFTEIADAVNAVLEKRQPALFGDINAPEPETRRIITTPPAWSYLKIAEGCDNRCAYCVIPDLRGRFRSRGEGSIIAEARDMARRGVRELIIVAQDITRYGFDLHGEQRLSQLLTELCKIDEIKWIRLHYLYPNEIDDKLIDVIAKSDKILKYLDIPIQHINDGVLKAMGRRGTGGEIRSLFKRLREEIPGLVLRTSLIAGLPGEGEGEFEELCEFLLKTKIERAGVFPYSPEEGTRAAEMDRPDEETAHMRAEIITDLQSRIIDEYNESRIGSVTEVLIEGFDADGRYYGRSRAESPDIDGIIHIEGGAPEIGTFADILITGTIDGQLLGVPAGMGDFSEFSK